MALIDCSHEIKSGMSTYPDDPPVTIDPHTTHESDGYRVTAVIFGTHTGTHIDAPSHTEPGGDTLSEFPMSRFVFDARMVDVTEFGQGDAIPPATVPQTDAELLVFQTGWDSRWGTDAYLDHPYLAPATARRCATAGYDIAMDTMSPDPTPTDSISNGVPAHHELLGSDSLIIENLRGLDRLPKQFELTAFPLALDGDGAPVRAVVQTDV